MASPIKLLTSFTRVIELANILVQLYFLFSSKILAMYGIRMQADST